MKEQSETSLLVQYLNFFAVAGIITILYLINWYKRPKRFPPGPRGVPIFGYLPFLKSFPEHSAYEISKTHGPVVSIRIGPEDMVFLNNFESIHTAIVKNGTKTSGRFVFPPLEPIYKDLGIIFLDYGEKWKAQRKFGLMTLRGFGVGKKGMEDACKEELEYLNEEFRKQNGKPFDMSDLLHKAISNITCSIVFGERFDYSDERFSNMLEVILSAFGDPTITLAIKLISFAPKIRFIPPIYQFHQKYLQSVLKLFEMFDKIIKDHEKTFDENNIRDFVDAFLVEKNKGTDPSFTKKQLIHYMADLFSAGTETTSSTALWSILCLIHYPEAQTKLRKEIHDTFGTSGRISVKKADMPYTNAFIQELFRFRTLAPLSVPHKVTEDIELNGFRIPKGTAINPNFWAVHNDPNLWKDPEIFNPDRFLDEDKKFVPSNFVIPFSIGPRHCLGEQLAKMEVFIFLVGLVQKFEFLPDPTESELPVINDGFRSIAYVPKPFNVVVKQL